MKIKGAWVVLTLILSGCTDPLTKLINEKFPPINIEQQRQAAIDTTAEALSVLQTPNIALSINLSHAEKALNTDSLHKQGVTELKISGEKQLIHIHLTFSKIFTEADAGDNADIRKVLATIRPEIGGEIDVYTGLSGAIANDLTAEPELQIRLLPGLSRIDVKKVRLVDKVDATKIGEVLATLLNKYRDNITGELSRSPLSRMTVPAVSDKPSDMSQALKVTSPGKAFIVNLKANPVTVSVMLAGITWLINENQLTALLQFSPRAKSLPPPAVKIEKTFDAINGQITGFVNSSFGIKDSVNTTWVAVRKDLLATTMNSGMTQAAACMSAAGSSHQEQDAKVPMPDADGITCSSDRNCESNRTCTFSANHDERDCSACLLSAPRVCSPRICAFGGCIGGGCTGGQCVQRGNDPICELAKAAQNQIYLADANLRKADCDRLRAMETAGCQAEELGKKVLCEAGKATLKALRKTGNFANIDVESDINSDNLNVCVREFSLSPGLEHVAVHLDVTGKATANVNVKFVPLDIVGHLACQFPWQEKQRFNAELRDSRVDIKSDIKIDTTQEKPRINFVIDETTVKAKLSPGPTEFLLKSPNMTVSCAGLNFIKPLLVTLTPFLPALRGDIDHKLDKQEVSLELSLPVVKVGNFNMRTAASETPQSLVLTGTLIEKP
ncbi:MAG: hypothetical protein H8J66_02650 [Nitrospira sp.]|nr:hypothetical protein [Nitrospira sp.]